MPKYNASMPSATFDYADKDAIMKNIFKPMDNKEKAKSLIDNLNSEELTALREALAERTNNNDNVSL